MNLSIELVIIVDRAYLTVYSPKTGWGVEYIHEIRF